MRVAIGLDLGTSAVKAVALNEEGALVAQAGARYPTVSPQPGWAEQDPADWRAAAFTALRSLTTALPADALPHAVALSGQLPTLVLLDAAGKPLRPAIVWYDGRAHEQAIGFLQRMGAAEWCRRTGIVLDAHYLAPMHAWVAGHEPEVLGHNQTPLFDSPRLRSGGSAGPTAVGGASFQTMPTEKVLPRTDQRLSGSASPPIYRLGSAKDALLHALCGAWRTDPSTASGSGIYNPLTGVWDEELCRVAGIDLGSLPALAQPTALAGGLGPDWIETGMPLGLPVYVGAGDALTGVLGSGAATPGTLAMITGTSTSMVVTTARPVLDPGGRALLTPHALPALWGSEMDLMATGSAVRWLEGILGQPPGTLDTLAAQSVPGARGLLACPYLAGGEQGALWDPQAPAAFLGFRLHHTGPDLARALLEGIAFESLRCLLAWSDMKIPVDEVVVSGGMATPFFAELLAAVLGRPVRLAAGGPSSAVGAALLAGIGAGIWGQEQAMAIARRGLGAPVVADPGEIARYQELYAGYERASAAIRGLGVESRKHGE
ncbi:MAG TPA: FGGY family carbohydrate kinase [Chloroflexota bacterium]|nr:FGGY family carbohydrate kinase [Chloroflexota bacterium]